MTYSHNPIPEPDGIDSIPLLFRTPFYKDVTDEYVRTSNFSIDLSNMENVPSYAYLAIFNNLEWLPVAWSKIRHKQAVFTNIGREVVYLPVRFNGRKQGPLDYPFLLDVHGKTKRFVPDNKRITLKLIRKYPFNEEKVMRAESLKGCRILASNNPQFINADTLVIIEQTNPGLNYQTIDLVSPHKYRYWRIYKPGQNISISEWKLFDERNKQVGGTAIPFKKEDGSASNVIDGNILTYSDFNSWLTIDLKKPHSITSMQICPRTDGNGIMPGDTYELAYFGKNGWQVIGKKKADKDYLQFDNVPSNALYWLKDLTHGKEERIFSYTDGKIIFY